MDQLDFLELCSIGDWKQIREILERRMVDINYQHKINGWTALHWASRRDHRSVVELLLKYGADPKLVDTQGRTAADVASDQSIIDLLGGSTQSKSSEDPEQFVPNYLRDPPFPHAKTTKVNQRRYSEDKIDNRDQNQSPRFSSTFLYVVAVAVGITAIILLMKNRSPSNQ